MVMDFATPDSTVDPAASYRDASAPTDADPAEQLFAQLSSTVNPPVPAPTGSRTQAVPAAQTVPAPVPGRTEATPAPVSSPAQLQGSGAGVPTAGPPINPGATAPAAGNSTGNASPDSQALLARLAGKLINGVPITSLDQLKGKSDIDLRKLSGDVVAHENRQAQLSKLFFKNPDGSFDFSRGPDGTATGLDATGKPIPPAGSTPKPAPKPAAKPKAAAKPAAKKPAAKPKPAAKRPAPRRAPARHRAAVKPKPKARPKPKPAAVTPKPTTRTTYAE